MIGRDEIALLWAGLLILAIATCAGAAVLAQRCAQLAERVEATRTECAWRQP